MAPDKGTKFASNLRILFNQKYFAVVMEIEILNTHKNDFSPVIGERTMELLSRFGQKIR